MVLYFKCNKCEELFFCSSEIHLPNNLMCGGGCGGQLDKISEEEMEAALDEIRRERHG